MVWRFRDWDGIVLLWLDGAQFSHRGMGRYSICITTSWAGNRGSIEIGLHAQRWLYVDVVQLPMQRGICAGHAEANKTHELQGFR